MGSPKGEVFHLASLSRKMLDSGVACTVSTATPGMLPAMRPIEGYYNALTHWLPLCQDDLARGAILDSIYIDSPIAGDDFMTWWAKVLSATPEPCAKAPHR
jgi:hypothetical protein